MKPIHIDAADFKQLETILSRIASYNNVSELSHIIVDSNSVFYRKADFGSQDIDMAPPATFPPLHLDYWDNTILQDTLFVTLYSAQGVEAQDTFDIINASGPEAAMILLIMSHMSEDPGIPEGDLALSPDDETAIIPYTFSNADRIEGDYAPKDYVLVYNPTTLKVQLLLKYEK